MRILINFIIIICLFNYQAAASPLKQIKVVTTITPIASIIASLCSEQAAVSAINRGSSCPHHYQAKLSDREILQQADYFIYVDDKFDSFATKMLPYFDGKIIKVSDFSDIKFQDRNNKINWHFWLSLDNIEILQAHLAKILIQDHPQMAEKILINQRNLLNQIQKLRSLYKENMTNLPPLLLVSDSLEHFFTEQNNKAEKFYLERFYLNKTLSLKRYQELDNILQSQNKFCIVMDNTQDVKLFARYNNSVIQLNSENWAVENTDVNYDDLFFKNYLQLINSFSKCKNNN